VVERLEDAVDDVVDVRVIAPRRAVAVERDRLPAVDEVDELVDRHLGALPRPVDREEAQAGGRDPVQVVVRVRQQLAGALGGRVRRDGAVDVLVLAERDLLVLPVHARGAGKEEPRRRTLPQLLEQDQRPAHVHVGVVQRILERGPHARHRGQVDHGLEGTLEEQLRDETLVPDVAGDDPRPFQRRDVFPLQRRVVEVVEVVEDRDFVPAREQLLGDVRADEAGAAGDENGRHHSTVTLFARFLGLSMS
jgi:hypothetical protein